MAVTLPATHLDLLCGSTHGILTTMMPDGQPQSSVVWVDYDGSHILINTALERQKERNMRKNPKVTLLVIDPQNTSRWIEVRGKVVEMTTDRAEAHADALTQRYTGKPHFYGDVYPLDQKHKEVRIVVKIEPLKVSLDAIFK